MSGNCNRLKRDCIAARKLAAREITAVALLADCLERIAERESDGPRMDLPRHRRGDAARTRARFASRRPGLLHGLPIAVKDLFDTFDMPTAYGSPIYAGHRPAWDAACVALARAAGAIVVGKTVTTEFATFHPGTDVQSAQSAAHARRLVVGLRGGGRRLDGSARVRLADGGIDRASRGVLRRRRIQADLRHW